LSEVADGTLPAGRAAGVDGHLQACDACRATLADLRAIRQTGRTLERRTPPDGIWQGIADRLSPAGRPDVMTPPPAPLIPAAPGMRGWIPKVAFAAAALVVVTTVVGVWLRENPPLSDPAAPEAALGAVDVVMAAERDYQEAIVGLEQIARAGDDELDPEIAATLNDNIAIVDQAIGDARGALETEPQDEALRRGLLDAFRSKIVLLEQMVMLVNEMRQGNQAEAAEIIGNLQQTDSRE
jgi:hypothetical protein